MNKTPLGYLSPFAIEALCVGVVIFLGCLGIRIIRSPEVALKAANVQLNVSSNAAKLKDASVELEAQAELIEQKEQAYQELLTIYESSLKGKQGYGKLQTAIEKIEFIPDVQDIDITQREIKQVEKDIDRLPME